MDFSSASLSSTDDRDSRQQLRVLCCYSHDAPDSSGCLSSLHRTGQATSETAGRRLADMLNGVSKMDRLTGQLSSMLLRSQRRFWINTPGENMMDLIPLGLNSTSRSILNSDLWHQQLFGGIFPSVLLPLTGYFLFFGTVSCKSQRRLWCLGNPSRSAVCENTQTSKQRPPHWRVADAFFFPSLMLPLKFSKSSSPRLHGLHELLIRYLCQQAVA